MKTLKSLVSANCLCLLRIVGCQDGRIRLFLSFILHYLQYARANESRRASSRQVERRSAQRVLHCHTSLHNAGERSVSDAPASLLS